MKTGGHQSDFLMAPITFLLGRSSKVTHWVLVIKATVHTGCEKLQNTEEIQDESCVSARGSKHVGGLSIRIY